MFFVRISEIKYKKIIVLNRKKIRILYIRTKDVKQKPSPKNAD